MEISGEAVNLDKKKKEVHVDTVADLVVNEKYKDLFNDKKNRDKHRNVGKESPFHRDNKPPQDYLDQDKILEKPCKIDLKGINTSQIPLAGKLGALGAKIMSDPKHAKHFTTGPWDAIQNFDHEPRALHGRKIKPIAGKVCSIEMANHLADADNF